MIPFILQWLTLNNLSHILMDKLRIWVSKCILKLSWTYPWVGLSMSIYGKKNKVSVFTIYTCIASQSADKQTPPHTHILKQNTMKNVGQLISKWQISPGILSKKMRIGFCVGELIHNYTCYIFHDSVKVYISKWIIFKEGFNFLKA